MSAGDYQRLIDDRTQREPYASRKLRVTVDVTPTSGRFVITTSRNSRTADARFGYAKSFRQGGIAIA